MPFARCPTCKQSFHLQVSDLEVWYRERWPSVPIGAEVPEECPACWATRTGAKLEVADRLRPYTRAELLAVGDSLPARGRVCPGCHQILPRFADLTPEVEMRMRQLSLEGRKIMAVQELIAATGCSLKWAQIWVTHPTGPDLHEKTGKGPDCYYCGKALRSPLACQCVECGMDWHDLRKVIRLGSEGGLAAGDPSGPPETLNEFPIVAWARIGDPIRPTGRTRHATPEGALPVAAALAIAKDVASASWYVFHCDSMWHVAGDTNHSSLAEAEAQALFEFSGIEKAWIYRPPPTRSWYAFENGQTVGKQGSEEGMVLRDEEHPEGARITLERDGHTPFAITCGIYGWMVHTCFFKTAAEANVAYQEMQVMLSHVMTLFPTKDDPRSIEKEDLVRRAITQFVQRYP